MNSKLETLKIYGYLLKNEANEIIYGCSRCDAVFNSSSQLEDHIDVHDSGEKLKNTLNDLPNECFDVIFKYLLLDDLASISETSRKYKELAESYFSRKHGDEQVCIYDDAKGKIGFFLNDDYKEYSGRALSLIRNLEVAIHDPQNTAEIFLKIKKNCAKHLKSLLIRSYSGKNSVEEIHIEIIAEQIQNLEVLAVLHDVHCLDYIIEKCKGVIKTLAIDYYIYSQRTVNWTHKNYPKLSKIILKNSRRRGIDLGCFLRLNPQLKTILSDDPLTYGSICSTKTDLLYARMEFHDDDELLEQMIDLKQCCKNGFIKSLDLLLDSYYTASHTLRLITDLKYTGGLHFKVGQDNVNLFEEIDSQPNMKRLCLYIDTEVTGNTIKSIAKCFPCIHELHICFNRLGTLKFVDVMLPFIAGISTLKHIYFGSFEKIVHSNDDMIRFDFIRSKLKDAFKVKVHLPGRFRKWNFIRPNGMSLTFEVEDSTHCFCDGCWVNFDVVKSLNINRHVSEILRGQDFC